MVMEVEALVTKDTRGFFTRGKVPRRDVGDKDVLINIHYAGICHSDYHTVKAEWGGQRTYPLTPGHEIAGIVEKVGAGVTKFKEGERVGVGCFVDSCRSCENCKKGDEQYCAQGMLNTYDSDTTSGYAKDKRFAGKVTYGGYSQKIVVDENYVCNIPEALPLEHTAPLLCAGITTYSPLVHYGAKEAGSKWTVGIVGLGGLGDMGAKISMAMGNKVSVISTSERKRDYALNKLKVDEFIVSGTSSESLAKMGKEHGGKFNLILCSVAADFDLQAYLSLLKVDGTFVMMGAPPNPLQLAAFSLIGKRIKVGGTLIGGIRETQEMLDFCAEHKIWSEVEHIQASEVNRAYQQLGTNSSAKQRFVIDVLDSLKEGDWEVDQTENKNHKEHVVSPYAQIVGAENTAGKKYIPSKDVFVDN